MENKKIISIFDKQIMENNKLKSDFTGATASFLMEDHHKLTMGIFRTTNFIDASDKALQIKIMGLVFRLMENGHLWMGHTNYQGYAPNYGVTDWDEFWAIYNNIRFEELTRFLKGEWLASKMTTDSYESEAGDIAYEDWLNNMKIW